MTTPNESRFLDANGRLTQWPTKKTDKLLLLAYLASKFGSQAMYQEKEVNELLKTWHTFNDWPLLRRELYEQGFLDRNRDGTNYHLSEIQTGRAGLVLVKPSVERDARAGVRWLSGDDGRDTLRLMGNTDEHNKPSTLEEERERVRDFITSPRRLTWMIRYQGQVIGATWADLHPTPYLPAPAIHIMIGDKSARGQGIGSSVIQRAIGLVKDRTGAHKLYSRYLTSNHASASLLAKAGFKPLDKPYDDEDGLNWQNVALDVAKG